MASSEISNENTNESEMDLINRRDAIDAVETKIKKWNAVDGEGYHVGLGLRYTDVIDTLTELPPAQHDIIRCKDCRYYQDNNGGYPHMNCKWDANETPDEDDFCSGAEWKEGETDERPDKQTGGNRHSSTV